MLLTLCNSIECAVWSFCDNFRQYLVGRFGDVVNTLDQYLVGLFAYCVNTFKQIATAIYRSGTKVVPKWYRSGTEEVVGANSS